MTREDMVRIGLKCCNMVSKPDCKCYSLEHCLLTFNERKDIATDQRIIDEASKATQPVDVPSYVPSNGM